MPRIFIAIRFNDEFKSHLVSLQEALKTRGVKGCYCPFNNLHLTLAFIGENCNLPAICAAVSEVQFEPFPLSLGNLGSFPTKSGVIWCGIKESGPTTNLANKLREHLSSHGVSFSKTEFYPHISLVQSPSSVITDVNVPSVSAHVSQIYVMKSERINGELVYSEVYPNQ